MANWVVDNLENSLDTWNEKMTEIWTLVTESPKTFKDGEIWTVMETINGAVQAVGYEFDPEDDQTSIRITSAHISISSGV